LGGSKCITSTASKNDTDVEDVDVDIIDDEEQEEAEIDRRSGDDESGVLVVVADVAVVVEENFDLALLLFVSLFLEGEYRW